MAGSTPISSLPLSLIPLLILSLILLLGIDALHLQLSRISYNDLVAPLLDPNDDRLRKTYTSLAPIDNILTVVLTMFMPIFTGEMPQLTMFTASFGGQVPAVVALMVVEGMRRGRAWGLTFSATWMIAMQVVGYGVIMPLYYILDLLFSSHDRSNLELRRSDELQWRAFIAAITLGYLVPSALQVLPVSEDLHQIFLAIWQPFPIYVVFLLWLISQTSPLIKETKTKKDVAGIRRIYSFAMWFGIITHWTTILLVLFRSQLFTPSTAQAMSFYNIFIPHPVRWYGPSTIAQASMQFLQWDLCCGALAGLVWAATLAHRAGAWEFGLRGIGEVVRDVAAMGIPCAVLRLLWRRDSVVMG